MRRWLLRIVLVVVAATAGTLAALALMLRRTPPPPPAPEPGRHDVRVVETRRVVPGPGLPHEVEPQASNNNLDAVRHAGRVYLAFRSAPHHFASEQAKIQVVSSEDEERWRFEASYHLGSDVREPRLLSLGDSLFLYVSQLGKDALAFEPQGIHVAERRRNGTWTPLEPIGPAGTMGWRARMAGDTPVLMVYAGGESLYSLRGPHLRVEMWKTRDGRRFEPYDPEHPVVYAGGGSEADFALGDDGTLYGVIRNEAGDASGWGSKVCRAEPGDLADWTCRSDPRKFDSPFMFWHDGEAYLVARRQLANHGRYDLGRGPGWLLRTLWNQVNYSLTPKRSALWRYVQDEDRFAFVLDLPSRGDTSFAAVIRGDPSGEFVVYDYSSDVEGEDVSWLRGQRGDTHIYRHVLRFSERDGVSSLSANHAPPPSRRHGAGPGGGRPGSPARCARAAAPGAGAVPAPRGRGRRAGRGARRGRACST